MPLPLFSQMVGWVVLQLTPIATMPFTIPKLNGLIILLVFALHLPFARGQDTTPPAWSSLTDTQRYLSSLYLPTNTTPWSDATAIANVNGWGERGSFQACGMLQRNQGSDRANAFKVLQQLDALLATGSSGSMSEFGGMGLVAAKAYYGNLFDATTAAAVDHALQFVATGGYHPGTDAGRNPDWTNYAVMNALVLNYCGAVYNNSTWTSVAATRMANIQTAILRNNCDPEHNSPTYEGVAMTALALGAKLGQDADFRAKSAAMKNVLWADIALHYNASLRNLSGPYYRAYSDTMDFTRACAETGMPILAYTQDLANGPGANYAGNTATRFCILNGLSGLGTDADVPDTVKPSLLNFQGNRRFSDVYTNTYTVYTHDVAIEEDRMAAVINSYVVPYPYSVEYGWDPFGFPSYQLVMTILHWKSGVAGKNTAITTLKIYDSSYYRTRFNADGEIEVLLDRVGASYPLRFIATSSSATPAAVSPTRWDIPGQSFDVVTSLPTPSVTVSGDQTTILYDTTTSGTNSVVMTLKYVKTPTHNWLGGQFKTATLLEASSAGAANSAGLYVTQMASGSAGYTAGLRVKDILTSANGQTVKYPEDLFRAIRAANGGSVSLIVRRSGANVTVPPGSAVPQATAINAASTPAYAWRNSRGGTWSTAVNWRNGSVPVTTGSDTVSFADADLIFDSTLNLDASPTVGGLLFGDVQPTDNWLVSGTGSFNLAPSAGTPVIEVINQTTLLAVPLAGSAGLRKTGTGRLVLSATNSSYTGATTVASGALQFANPYALYRNSRSSWTDSNLVVQNGAAAVFNVGGSGEFTAADLDALKGLGTATGGFLNGSAIGFDTTNAVGGNFTYSSAIAAPNGGANSMGIAKYGAGTLTLTNSNTYTGSTNVTAGTLVADTAGALGTGNLTVSNDATCELNNPSGALSDTASVYLAPGGTLHLGSGVNETVSRLYINGLWQPSGTWNATRDPLHFSGSGNLIVLNGDPNTPTGVHVMPGNGSVGLGWTSVPGATAYTIKRSAVSGGPYTTVATQAGISFTDSTATNGTTYYYVITSTVGGVESSPSGEAIATPGASIWTGATSTAWENGGNWNASASPTSTSVAEFAGSLTTNQPSITGANSVGGLLFESPGWALNSGSAGTLTVGAGGIVVNATSGTITLNKAVTVLNGGTRVWKGKTGSHLVLASLGTPAATTPLQWGDPNDSTYQGTLKLTYSSQGPNVPFLVRGGTLEAHKSNWINNRDLTVYSGGTFLVTLSNGDLIRDTYPVTLSGGLINWNGYNEVLATLNLNGGTLRGSNSTLTVSNAVSVGADTTLGDAADVGKLKLARSGTTASLDLVSGTRTLTVNSPVELALPVINGALVKQGTGTLILSASNTYSGGTTLNSGVLQVNGSLAPGSGITIGTAGSLIGTGTINCPVTVSGTFSPGLSGTGTLKINNSLTFAAGSSITITINRSATPNCTGASGITSLAYSGTLNVTNAGGTLQLGDRFVLFPATGFSGTPSEFNLPVLGVGLGWNTSKLAVDGSISVVDVAPPQITVPANMSVLAAGANGAVVNFTTSATDTVSGPCATTNIPASGSVFPLGTTTVTVTATDAAGNTASKTFTVTVAPPPISSNELAAPRISLSGTSVNIFKSSVAGRVYQLQSSPDLTSGSWQNIGSVSIGTGTELQFTSPIDPPESRRFYRLKLD